MARSAMIIPRHSWCLATLSICLLLSSCQTHGEVEHLEHVTPEHKPASYAGAVVQLQQRFAKALDGTLAEHHRTPRLAQLADIIRWLPEIAAESDLKKYDWEQVEQISQRLMAWQTELSANQPFSQEQRQEIERDLEALVALSNSSDRFQVLKQNNHDESINEPVNSLLINKERQ